MNSASSLVGLTAPSDWINFDASPTLRLQRLPIVGRFVSRGRAQFPRNVLYGDVTKGLPIKSGSCRAVFASHVLEHLSLADCIAALGESFRILRRGGILRVVVPDLQQICSDYLEDHRTLRVDASHRFMRASYLGVERRPSGVKSLIEIAFGNSKHLWMWDAVSLGAAIKEAGFSSVRVAQFGDSSELAFRSVEDEGRFVSAAALEATK